MSFVLRLRRLYWSDPYEPKPEPLKPLPELIERAKQARAEVADMTTAADMNRGRA